MTTLKITIGEVKPTQVALLAIKYFGRMSLSYRNTTFHNSTIVFAVSCWISYSIFPGCSLKRVFRSSPIRLVQSQVPDPFSSAFRLFPDREGHTTTINGLGSVLEVRCYIFFFPAKRFSFSFHCITSSIRLPISTSVTRSIRWSSS